jgi:hypothetical protein
MLPQDTYRLVVTVLWHECTSAGVFNAEQHVKYIGIYNIRWVNIERRFAKNFPTYNGVGIIHYPGDIYRVYFSLSSCSFSIFSRNFSDSEVTVE